MTAGKVAAVPERKIYEKAPIVEAVIDIKVVYPKGKTTYSRPECAAAFKSIFPRSQPIFEVSMGFSSGQDGAVTASQKRGDAGWRLSNDSENRILQIQQQGFTYSHLHPYTRWEVFKAEAQPLWDTFVKTCEPQRITRVAMRYINLLKFPGTEVELKDYLNLYPEAPSSIGPFDGMAMQLRSRLPEIDQGGRFVITLTPAQAQPEKDVSAFVLDLDVFCEREFEINDPKLWSVLQSLRDGKNRLFEAVLTDRMKERIS
jgi:uncharacterized protein (TIGR04255 family)